MPEPEVPVTPTPPPGSARPSPGPAPTPRWRRPLAIGLIILAGIVMLVASMTVWVKRQALDTNNWTEASSQLLTNDQTRHALSVYLVDQAFAKADPASELRGRLPTALQPLAAQLAASLRGSAINVADEILSRPAAQRLWEEANRIAHKTLLAVIDEGKGVDAQGDVALDLRPLTTQVRTRLGLDPLVSQDTARLVVMRKDQVDNLRTLVKVIRGASVYLWFAVLILFGLGIWLARGWRHRAVMITGWTIVAVGLALLIIRRLAGAALVDALAGNSQATPGADSAWLIATTLLRDEAQGILAIGALLVVGAWIVGQSRSAVAVRKRLAPVFRRQPLAVYGGFVLFILLLLLVLPGGSGRRLVGTLVLFALLLAGLEFLRRTTLQEFPGVPAPASGPAPPVPAATGGDARDREG